MKTLALAGTLFAAGCASMVNGSLQKVPVTSLPSHAAITLDCPGQEPHHVGYTPAEVTLRRDGDGCRIILSKLGYEEETIRFRRVRNPVTAFNAVPGLVLGAFSGLAAYIPAELALPDPVADDIGKSAFNAGVDVPFAVDERNGAAFEQVPRRVSVELVPRQR
jgi:hypothetical protein